MSLIKPLPPTITSNSLDLKEDAALLPECIDTYLENVPPDVTKDTQVVKKLVATAKRDLRIIQQDSTLDKNTYTYDDCDKEFTTNDKGQIMLTYSFMQREFNIVYDPYKKAISSLGVTTSWSPTIPS